MAGLYPVWIVLFGVVVTLRASDGTEFSRRTGFRKVPTVETTSSKYGQIISPIDSVHTSDKSRSVERSKDRMKHKRSSSDTQCYSFIEINDTKTVGHFKKASVTLYVKASENFQRMEVNLHLKGIWRLSPVKTVNQIFSLEDLGLEEDFDRWHKLHVGVYAEGSEYLGGQWEILVINDDESALSSKPACLRFPKDEVIGLDVIASGQSEWRCERPPGFKGHYPVSSSRTARSGDVSHRSVVAFAVGLLALLGLLTVVVFLLRFLLKKKKKMKRSCEDRVVLRPRDREIETSTGISNARPVSAHSTDNSLYGVIISRDVSK
ncbi:uncharacterized protein [Palaemon carinicauda]|uniref:uncharacterized protein n=1 Tax=Palaemon carinicauda TaxID=392227 RepID=UPI0035B63F1E